MLIPFYALFMCLYRGLNSMIRITWYCKLILKLTKAEVTHAQLKRTFKTNLSTILQNNRCKLVYT